MDKINRNKVIRFFLGFLVIITLLGLGFYVGWINSNYQGKTAKEWEIQNNASISENIRTQNELNDEIKKYGEISKSCGNLLTNSTAIYTLSKEFSSCLGALTTYSCNGSGNLVNSSSVIYCMQQYGMK